MESYCKQTNLEKIIPFRKFILEWYRQNGRKFPWRNVGISNYKKVITEVLLQRTKAETIAKFYPIFFKKYPSWESINKSRQNTLEKTLIPIGLFRQRSVLLKKLAKEMVQLNGRLPKTKEEIEKLPSAGQYLTNAILLLIKNVHAPLLDVNMARVLERYFGSRKLADIRYDPYLQELAWEIVNHKEAKKINWGILDFGALVCKKKRPNCEICILKKNCLFI